MLKPNWEPYEVPTTKGYNLMAFTNMQQEVVGKVIWLATKLSSISPEQRVEMARQGC